MKQAKLLIFLFFLVVLFSFSNARTFDLVLNASSSTNNNASIRWVNGASGACSGRNITYLGRIQEFTRGYIPYTEVNYTLTNEYMQLDDTYINQFAGWLWCDNNDKCGVTTALSGFNDIVAYMNSEGAYCPIGSNIGNDSFVYWLEIPATYTSYNMYFDFVLNQTYYNFYDDGILIDYNSGFKDSPNNVIFMKDDVISDIEFNRILLNFTIDSAKQAEIESITFYNITDSDNQLPTIDVSVDSTYICLTYNETFPYVVEVDIEVQDLENDTIYYALSQQQYVEKSIRQSVDYYNPFGLIDSKDFSFYRNVYRNDDSCDISRKFNISQLNLLDYWTTDYSFKTMLHFNPVCSGVNEMIYDLRYSLQNMFYYTDIYDLDTVSEYFNLTFYDKYLTEQFKVKYEYFNSTHMKIYEYNLTGTEFLELEAFSANQDHKEFSISLYSGTGQSYILNFNTGEVLNLSQPVNSPIMYIGISTNGNIAQEEFQYSGISLTYNWTTDFSNNLIFTAEGLADLAFLVTDEAHLNSNEYNIDYLFMKVEQKEFCYNTGGQVKDDIELVVGESFSGYFDFIELRQEALNFLWFLFFALIVFFSVVVFMSKGFVDLPLSLLLSSVICGIFAIFLSTSIHLIVFIITFVIGLAGLLMRRTY